MKWINEIRKIMDTYFSVTNIESDTNAVAFFVRDDPDILESFEEMRVVLKRMGFLATLRIDESRASMKDMIQELAVTPQLREISQRILDAKENEVRRAWMDRFFELATCPQCGSNVQVYHGDVTCSSCYWSPQGPVRDQQAHIAVGDGHAGDGHIGGAHAEDGHRSDELKGDVRTPAHGGKGAGYVIVVSRLPKIDPRSTRINIALLILTIITTTVSGSTLWMGYNNEPVGDSFLETIFLAVTTPGYLGRGALYFALPLMAILGTHELGHYFMARHHGVNASLPFFIPIPPGISPLGTFGAFISLREPIPNKKVLFDIGIAGPIAGLIMAIPVIIIGFLLTDPVEHVYVAGHGPNIGIEFPMLFQFLYDLVNPDGGLHPTAFAGWVGLFVTALNLLPAGQLDGGHIVRAFLGERSKYLSYTTLFIMIFVGMFIYPTWLILGILILVLGAHHPPPLNDISDLDIKRKAVGVFSIVLLLLCITPRPFIPLEYDINVLAPETEFDISPGETINFTIYVENTGYINNTYDIENASVPEHWNVSYSMNSITLEAKDDNPGASKAAIIIQITAPLNATPLTNVTLKVRVISQNISSETFSSHKPRETIPFILHVRNPYDLALQVPEETIIVRDGSRNTTRIVIMNTGREVLKIRVHAFFDSDNATGWDLTLHNGTQILQAGASGNVSLEVSGSGLANGSSIDITIIAQATTPTEKLLDHGTIHAQYLEGTDEDSEGQ